MKEEELSEIHEKAIKELNKIISALHEERQQCLSDRRFYSIAGAQWEGDLQKQYANRPKIEINKVHSSVIRIINEARSNRITVDFVSKDGSKNEHLANTCDGLYRSDEQDSTADEAYDNAFEEAVGGGFGAWRLRADYEDEYDEEDERQRIRIEPIYDADTSVYFNLDAKRQDKADAKCCFVLSSMTYDEFEEVYGRAPTSVNKDTSSDDFEWVTTDVAYIAEYYEVEIKTYKVFIFESLEGEEVKHSEQDLIDEDGLLEELTATGYKQVREKKVKQKKIRKYIIDGDSILEDCGYIAGTEIPIIPIYGKRWFIDNIERCMGHVRLSRDAQILKNIQYSNLAEISSLFKSSKPILAPEQVKGLNHFWEKDNTENYPYLLLNTIENQNGEEIISGPLGYTQPPVVPPALAALMQVTEQDMKEMQGNDQALEQVNSNLSGEAISKLQDKLDMQTYIYVSNKAKAMQRCGEVWLSMAKELYVEDKRQMKTVNQDNQTEQVTLLEPYKEDGKTVTRNDLSNAKFNVHASVGAATSSKKQATAKNILAAMQATADQELLSVLSNTLVMNMEGEGLEEIKPYLRKKMLRMGAVQPTEQELKEMAQEAQNQQPTAEETYLQQEAGKAEALAKKANADTIKTIKDAEKIEAQTIEIMSDIERQNIDQAINAIDKFKQ